MSVNIESTAINQQYLSLPYITGSKESKGYEEINSYYYPRGPIKRVLSYFRGSGGLIMYTGNCEFYEFDHIARNILGKKSFESSIQRTIFGGGKGFDLPTMMASSLGEVIERAMGSFISFAYDDQLIHGTYKTMLEKGFNCLHPSELPLFADEQYEKEGFEYERFTEDTFVGWIQGECLLNGSENIWVPAQIVMPFNLLHPKENMFCYATSGGLATHITKELAVYHGISEVLERDAVNVHWNTGHAPKIIELDCMPDDFRVQRILEHAQTLVDNITLYLHMTDVEDFYTVTAVGFVEGFNKYNYISGGGGGLTIEDAILSALGEFAQAEGSSRIILNCPQWVYSERVKELFFVEEDVPVEKFDIFYKVIGHYGYPSHAKKLQWYLEGSGKVKLSELMSKPKKSECKFEQMLEISRKNGLNPIFFDFTLPNLQTVRLTKVFCTKLTPPYLHSMPSYGVDRYFELPQKLNWKDRKLTFEDLTKSPQPYP
ncbi:MULTISPECIES: YcaO-like family protein [unclassified Pseudoalteromonas]|uniref:YcaO-like family protein n=1 Tax=unclassified Pseudoalteromonas TaxID=194690 RepID=UPI0016010CE8|nr:MULTISPECIES: YcaO-like family protein [unclassified Pseudoalteromonas]MBB1295555.1 YcaO-like family protein [Pseudoalteromonas sp. SR41-4]MBB1399856.1 YcaO-like family protein [Pseudoalteromonas sp. SG44-8]MBB1411528.1 YcaO-like family protein [Pseudoalteromonas sp. SG44-17]MBB1507839.1 YcaO-like family protein [Pseudoalteromonas sp. SG41-1]